MVKHDVAIVVRQSGQGRVVLLGQVLYQNIPLAHQIGQDISQSEQVITVDVFSMPVIEIKVNPSVMPGLSIHKNVIPSDISVFFSVVVQEMDGPNACQKPIEYIRECIMQVVFMVHWQI